MPLELPLHIREHIDAFTGRTWLLPKLQTWLRERNERVFLITGLPGAGKSMLAAWLAGFGPAPADPAAATQLAQLRATIRGAHFCIAGASVAPQDVIGGLARRLIETLPGFGQSLLASNGREVQITINQHAGNVSGSMTGVAVEHLVLGDITPERAISLLLVDPLRQLYAADYNTQVVLLVDSLDEAETASVGPKVAQLLGGLSHRPDLPWQVRILATTRPDPRVLAYFKPIPCESSLDLIDDAPAEADDIAQYAQERLAGLDADRRTVLAQKVATAAKGIFLYAHLVLEELHLHPSSCVEVESLELPRDLSDLYLQFLLREIGAEEHWYATYYHVLGLIAVAQAEGLSRSQIQRILGKSRPEVEPALRACAQYLAGSVPDGPFRPFHQSLTEFLLEDEHNTDRHIDAAEMHNRIASYYWENYHTDWSHCDDYGLHQLPHHLSLVGNMQRLSGLLSDYRWLQAKLSRTAIQGLLADYELALADATLPPADQGFLRLVQKALRLSSHILALDKDQLAGQLTGRLLTSHDPLVQALLQQTRERANRPWLRPVTPSLLPAVSPIMLVLSNHTYPVRAVAVTPDGKRALSAAEDKTLKVWDLQTGTELRTLTGHTDGVLAFAVGPNGRLAVSGSHDKTVRVWDLETGRQVRCIEAHEAAVSAIAITPDERHVVSGSYDATMKVWELDTGTYCRTLYGHAAGINAVALTPDGARLVSGSYDQTVRLWDVETGQGMHTFSGHQDQVSAVVVAPDGRLMVSASFDHTLRLWDLERKTELHTFFGHTDVVSAVAISANGQLISASWDRTLRVWDLAHRELVSVLAGHSYRVMGVAVTPEGQRVISASGDTTLNVWDLTIPAVVQSPPSDAGMVIAIAITPDSRYVVSYTREPAPRTYTVWDLETAAVVHTSRGYLNHVRDGRLMLKAGDGQTLMVRDLREQTQRVLPLGGWTNRKTIFLPDGQSLLFENLWTPIIHLVRSASADSRLAFVGHRSDVYDVAVTPDGKLAITGSDDRTVRVWELDTGKAICTLNGHTRQIWSVSVAGDGRMVVSASDDRDVIVWDIERQMLVARFSADGPLTACAISPDGTTVLAGDETGRIYILRFERHEC